MDPVVININKPKTPFQLPHLPKLPSFFTPRWTKILTASAAVVISLTMILMVGLTIRANNHSFRKKYNLGVGNQALAPETSGSSKSAAALPGGSTILGVGGTTGTDSPVVTLSATPGTVDVGQTVVLKWSVTNNPKTCTASEDWSGGRPSSGQETTPALTKFQTYYFTLTCQTNQGTGYSTVHVDANQVTTTGNSATAPSVTLTAVPAGIYTGQTSSIIWTVDNNATSCTASGSWNGPQSTSGGSFKTAAFSSTGTYTYNLSCTNSGGSQQISTKITVTDPPLGMPLVTLNISPNAPITPGNMATLTWTTTNNVTSCTASGDWTGNESPNGMFTTPALNTVRLYAFTLTCNNATGSSFSTASLQIIPNPPAVSLTVSPSTMYVGNSSTITWTATNNPSTCTASGNWSGAITPTSGGTKSTGIINSAGTYIYSLSCTNAGGTGYNNNVTLVVSLPPVPVVTLALSPISITAGSSANITWSATNSPTSCTASGSWSGTKAASGTQSTGTIATAGSYTYSLSCSNAGGSGSASATLTVSTSGPTAAPVVTISVSPTSIGTGSSATISWSATNSPTSCTASGSWSGTQNASGSTSTGVINTAGTKTYTLACTNSKGTGTSSATLTVIAVPGVTISVSPATITAGASSTITWSATNTPSSCTAGGSWSGTKAASGSVTTGTMSTAGTFTYSLSCTNTGGTGSASTSLTVSSGAPVYCSGKTPCYGPTEIAAYNTGTNCWAYNLTRTVNITNLNNAFHNNNNNGPGRNLLSNASDITALCGNVNLQPFLNGSASLSTGSHQHQNGAASNTGTITTYFTGYYDVNMP